MSRLLVLVCVSVTAVGATQAVYGVGVDSPPAWRQWLSLLFSRGLYYVLGLLILGCFVVNSIRNKLDDRSGQPDSKNDNNWSTQGAIIKTFLMSSSETQSNRGMTLGEMCSTNTNIEMAREIETRNNALKKELDQLNRIRLSLEERSGVLEKEKAAVEERLEETKLQAALEKDSLRKEAAVFQRQVQQLQQEKELLRREVESTSRDSRMTDCALRDQALLAERLEAARKEVAELQKVLEALRQERDTAVVIAADLAVRCQGVAGESTQIIGKYIKREMERSKPEEQSILKLVAGNIETKPENNSQEKLNEKRSAEEETQRESSMTAAEPCSEADVIEEVDDNNIASPETDCECPECANQQTRWNEMLEHGEQYLPCNELGLGPVTGSEAFRNFLISSFSDD